MTDKKINQPLQLNEVEAVLLSETSVADCAVLARENSNTTRKDVVAYIVGRERLEPSQLKAYLQDRLPPHLMPDAYVPVPSIPLTRDGQVDKQVLTDLEVIDSDLIHRWEENLRALPEIEQVAVVVVEHSENLPPLHLSDLLPGWNRDSKLANFRSSTQTGRRTGQNSERPKARQSESRQPAISHGQPLRKTASDPAVLSEALQHAVSEAPNRGVLYIQSDEQEIFQSYPALREDAERILAGLRNLGLKPQDKVILQLDGNQDFVPALWGCILGGFVPVPISIAPAYEPANKVVQKLRNTWEMLEKPIVLASKGIAQSIRSLFNLDFRVEKIDDLRSFDPDQSWHVSRPDDLALLMLTSGSTGIPKAVQLNHRNILNREAGTVEMQGFTGEDISLNWFPLDHVVGLIAFHLRDIYLGCQQIHASTELILQQPLKWLDLLSRFRVTLTWAPNFAYGLINEHAEETRQRHWDLSSVRYSVNGGEAVVAQTAMKFMELLSPYGWSATAMRPGWGMSETSSGVTIPEGFVLNTSVGDTPLVELGPPIPGMLLRIVDDENKVVEEKTIGCLQVKGEAVTDGYYQNPEVNQELFTEDGWFNTGDLGLLDRGRLTLTGRQKDVIIINGINYYNHEIEAVVEEIKFVERSYTVACAVRDSASNTDKLAIFFNSDRLDSQDFASTNLIDQLKEIRERVIRGVGINPDYLIPVEKDSIPKTAIGKVQRSELKQRFEAGEFDTILKRTDILSANANTLPDWFYRKIWRRKDAITTTQHGTDKYLVFFDQSGLGSSLCTQLRKSNHQCIGVEVGPDFAKLSPDLYCIQPTDPDHYRRLFASLSAENIQVNQIIHLWTYDEHFEQIDSLEALADAQNRGVYSLLFLVQALAEVHVSERSVRLRVVSSHAQPILPTDEIGYEKSPILGFIKTVPKEIPWLSCCHVDLPVDRVEVNITRILREIRTVDANLEVAYRNAQRFIPRLKKIDLRKKKKQGFPFKHGGLYLISGGLGGIGVEIAKYLLEHYEARLLLLGRTCLPERNRWDAYSDQEGIVSERIRAYRALEKLDGEILYLPVDICDSSRLQQAVDQAKRRWDCKLDGVIHLAGMMQTRLLTEETKDSFAETLAPKVSGTWNLYQLIKDQAQAKFISFSSVHTFFGGFTVGAYAAANSFLQAFSHYQNQKSSVRSCCFAWSLWDEIGINRGYQLKNLAWEQGSYAISQDTGLYSLLAGLQRSAVEDTPLLVGLDGNNPNISQVREMESLRAQKLHAYFTTQIEPFPIHSAGEALNVTDRFGKQSHCDFEPISEMPLTDMGTIDREKLMIFLQPADPSPTQQIAPQNEIERQLSKIWQEVLEIPQVGIHNSFFELGGGSLLLAQVHRELQRIFGQELSMVEMFKYPTVHALAKYLTDRQNQQSTSTRAQGRAEVRSKSRTLMQQTRRIRQKYRSKSR